MITKIEQQTMNSIISLARDFADVKKFLKPTFLKVKAQTGDKLDFYDTLINVSEIISIEAIPGEDNAFVEFKNGKTMVIWEHDVFSLFQSVGLIG